MHRDNEKLKDKIVKLRESLVEKETEIENLKSKMKKITSLFWDNKLRTARKETFEIPESDESNRVEDGTSREHINDSSSEDENEEEDVTGLQPFNIENPNNLANISTKPCNVSLNSSDLNF